MKYLKLYEEYETDRDFNKRSDYVIDLITNIKDILLTIIDNDIKVDFINNPTMIGMIANVLYDKEYLVTYNDYYKSVMSKDLNSLSDLFSIFIYLDSEKCDKKLTSGLKTPYYSLPNWFIDCLHHLESYMDSEGFKIEISLYPEFDSIRYTNPNDYIKFTSSSELEKFETEKKFRSIRIGFNI